MKEPLTRVIFRIDRKCDECVALFPAIAGTRDPWTCSCYAHVGQHSSATVDYVRASRLAKPAEYRDLAAELRRIGYRLKIVKRFTRKDYEARKEQIKL
jgi:hypothetical protein